jgi:hypothetical protein
MIGKSNLTSQKLIHAGLIPSIIVLFIYLLTPIIKA